MHVYHVKGKLEIYFDDIDPGEDPVSREILVDMQVENLDQIDDDHVESLVFRRYGLDRCLDMGYEVFWDQGPQIRQLSEAEKLAALGIPSLFDL